MLRLSPLAAQQLHCFSKAHCHSGKILGQLLHLGKKVLGQKSHLGNCRTWTKIPRAIIPRAKVAWAKVPWAKIAALFYEDPFIGC